MEGGVMKRSEVRKMVARLMGKDDVPEETDLPYAVQTQISSRAPYKPGQKVKDFLNALVCEPEDDRRPEV